MTRHILLTKSQKKYLADHAIKCLPNESCAILLGSTDNDLVTVNEIILAENADASPVEFSIKPDSLFDAYAKAESGGLGVVGVFHSHPSSEAKPSETDKKFMQINPGVWIIYSKMDEKFAAYSLDKEGAAYSVRIHTP